jgi:hypothetical protein
MAVECANFHEKARELKMFGFAIPDQGFYSIKIAGVGEIQKAAGIIQVLQGEVFELKIEEEVKNLVNKQWDWQVK